ncbi:MAG: amidohydrolase [Oscillospiraceae bacterium]|nr:amidohydrolase [Oscillospiraceae bacterium]
MKTLFSNVTAVLMDELGTVLQNAFVAVDGTAIAHVGTERPQGTFDREVDGTGKILMPGLVNCHTHLPMTMLRGYGGGCDLHTWLNQYIFPAEDKLDARAARAATGLALAELIASGVTCYADMYFFCDEMIEETLAAGISANIARGVSVFTPDFDFDTFYATKELKALVPRWNGCNDGQIRIDASVHAEYTSYPAVWRRIADYAKEQGIGMHVHVSETKSEHDECIGRHGLTPAAALAKEGVFDVRAIAAHCVWCTEEDMAILQEKGTTAVHCPASNLKLGSGVAPVPALLKQGVNVALGTDGVSSNNSHDMFEELKLAAILHNGVSHDPLAVLPMDALRMATCNGAKALGRPDSGSIAVGKTADLILLDGQTPNMTPCHSVVDNVAYACGRADLVMNMARGKVIYEKGDFLTLDLDRIRSEVEHYAMPLMFGKE